MKALALIVATLFALPLGAAEKDPVRCDYLRIEVKRIDAAALKRSTTALQERRRLVIKEMYELKCSRAGFK